MAIIDLRSDTVTLPTAAMREAISRAELGDDVFGEDPTINRLEAMTAERTGDGGGASGRQRHDGKHHLASSPTARRGEEVILGDSSHIFLNEAGGMSALGGIFPHTIPNQPDGTLRLEDIEAAIRADNIHFPRTRLICLENTHNRCYGAPLTPEYTAAVVGAREAPRPPRAPRRRPDLQRRGRPRRGCPGADPGRRFGQRLPLQGARRAGRLRDLREPRVHRAGAPDPQDAGRRDAPGGDHRGRGHRGPRDDDRPPRGGSRQRPPPGGGDRRDPGTRDRSRPRPDEHPLLSISPTGRFSDEEFLERLAKKGLRLSHTGPARFRMLTHYGIGAADIDAALASCAT